MSPTFRMRWPRQLAAAATIAAALLAAPAFAHPHVWVTARAEIVWDGEGRITAIRHSWTFDPAFSAFAVQGLDSDGDGSYSREELQPLAEVNVTSLEEYAFFTFAHADDQNITFARPTDYWLDRDADTGALTLHYTLPLATPRPTGSRPFVVSIYDQEYFVAFSLAEDAPIRLVNAPQQCAATIRRPRPLDPATAALLGAVPAEQRQLPENLSLDITALDNRIAVSC